MTAAAASRERTVVEEGAFQSMETGVEDSLKYCELQAANERYVWGPAQATAWVRGQVGAPGSGIRA